MKRIRYHIKDPTDFQTWQTSCGKKFDSDFSKAVEDRALPSRSVFYGFMVPISSLRPK
jgi:hypothetical protein